ncbi:MAG: chromosome segregation protein SMC [Halobacteriales archaeon SW_8_66_22]|nr:MAG: chromosome segregation protein SMC [Halobacteriales archaeon SW_8_66_22]
MWRLEIDNIAGIRSGTATLDPGLNVVQASNFQGKSSFAAAIRTVLGVTGQYDAPPLTEGAESGSVTLTTDDDSYEVTLERAPDGAVTQSGTPYLTDETDQVCARLFALLDEDNPIRIAVRDGADLTPLLQAPLDIADVDRRIDALQTERRDLEAELSRAEQVTERIPAVQESVTQLEAELEELRSRREMLDEEAERNDDDLADEVVEKRSTLEEYERHIEQTEAGIERKRERLAEKEAELEQLEVPTVDDDADVTAKRERIDELERKIDLLTRVSQVSREILEEGELDLITTVDRSLAGDEVECWTCGQLTGVDRMERRIDALRSELASQRERKETLAEEVERHAARQREAERKQREAESLREEAKRLRLDVEESAAELEQLEEKRDALEGELAELESALDEQEAAVEEELTDVTVRIKGCERRLSEKRQELADLEDEREDLAALRERREELDAELTALRNRKRDAQTELVAQFDEAMAAVMERFAPGFGGAHLRLQTGPDGDVERIDLVIAREGRETTVDALSEGEVELVGVALVLAGYRAFDVDERVPAVVVDGIGQLAAEHLHNLAEYLQDTGEYLVTTAYPEVGSFDGRTISPDEWEVVSDDAATPTD